jgi:hypothetical protein
MAFDKLVDSAKLEMEMTATAVAIRNKTGLTDTIPWEDNTGFANAVAAITVGGGSSEDVRYVTFKDDTGAEEYGKKAVATGDDCADPIARGVFDTPTKESTAQYSFTLGGWATTPGGGIDANALKAVIEDRTVYANFISVLRYYTITYYDSDGSTVLKTESLAYGAMPSYAPTKTGFVFDSWIPAASAVTGDASYTANWSEKITFSAGTWADIARIAESGQASKHFAVGDTKTVQMTWVNGSTADVVLEIIGINHDDLADGSGKAGITVCSKNVFNLIDFFGINTSVDKLTNGWATSNFRTLFNSTVDRFPEEMRQHIKTVKKVSKKAYNDPTTAESDDKLFMPSSTEFIGGLYDSLYSYGKQYAGFNTAAKRKKYRQTSSSTDTSTSAHATRQGAKSKSTWIANIDMNGSFSDSSTANSVSCFCFCI